MSFHPEVSYYDLAKDLDFVSWDNYPVWNKPTISYGAAMAADLMRGIKEEFLDNGANSRTLRMG